MSIISNAKEIADLVKQLGDVELYRRIVSLEGELIDLTNRKRELEDENRGLNEKLRQAATMSFRNPFWYAEGDEVAHCPRCWEIDKQAMHLQGPARMGVYQVFNCPQCKSEYSFEKGGGGPVAVSLIR
jgi:hypothetical protein